jgi:hypothetical protein
MRMDKILKRAASRLRAIGTVLLLAVSVIGCSGADFYMGKRPDTKLLETKLQPGVSSPEEVRGALGPPLGRGKSMMPAVDSKARKFWTYFYDESSVRVERGAIQSDSRYIYLFVYFDKGRYDGYMWFSSLPEAESLSN